MNSLAFMSPSQVTLFWTGLALSGIVLIMLLLPMWFRAFKQLEEGGHGYGLVPPTVFTLLAIAAAVLVLQGDPVDRGNFEYHNTEQSEARGEFIRQVEADREATKPQSKEKVEAQRASKAREKAAEERRKQQEGAASEAESYEDFRKKFDKLN